MTAKSVTKIEHKKNQKHKLSSYPTSSSLKRMDLNYRVVCRDCKDKIPDLVEDFASGDLICRRCGCSK